ncbi:MAG: hypothetical protein KAJ19_23605, partial [Gammaproteobacteria bacterium]|nr:hypothetical protein [Gammaproteobacteria bacterium]
PLQALNCPFLYFICALLYIVLRASSGAISCDFGRKNAPTVREGTARAAAGKEKGGTSRKFYLLGILAMA